MKNFDAQANQTQTRAGAAAHAAQGTGAPQQGEGMILLVEDDKVLRRYLEVLLRRAGYAVVTAADGIEAIKIVFSSKLAAVVTDAVMPRLGGAELCRMIRSRAEYARLPIVLLTGLARDDSAASSCEHADAQLTKPVRPDVLIDCLKRLLTAPCP